MSITPAAPQPSASSAEYVAVRNGLAKLLNAIFNAQPFSTFQTVARQMGVLRGRTMLIEHSDELAPLMDYCIFEHRGRDKLTPVQRYLRGYQPPGPLEAELAAALPAARFRLLMVEEAIRDRGLWCTDSLSDERCFITDRALSRTAEFRVVLGARSLDVRGMTVLTGMLCPIDQAVLACMYEPLARAMATGGSSWCENPFSHHREH